MHTDEQITVLRVAREKNKVTVTLEGKTAGAIAGLAARQLAQAEYEKSGGRGGMNSFGNPYAVDASGEPIIQPGKPLPTSFPADAKFRCDYTFMDSL